MSPARTLLIPQSLLRRFVVPVAVIALLLSYLAVPARAQGPAGYSVRIENLTTGQPFTPPLLAVHSSQTDVYEVGEQASEGVSQIAENGNLQPLTDALDADPDVEATVIADAPLVAAGTPGDDMFDSVGEYVLPATEDATQLSWVSMLICTNDGFTGLDAVDLPTEPGESMTLDTAGYESHTEVNTEDFADLVPPCQGLTGVSSDDEGTGESNPDLAEEDGVIALHDGIVGDDDLDSDVHGWTDPVARVTITALESMPEAASGYSIAIENLTAGQPFTPPVLAIHADDFGIYTVGDEATEAVRQIAENGNATRLDVALAGDEAVGAHLVGEAPVPAPGTPGAEMFESTATFAIDAVDGATQLSWVSMLICTNDGFTGLNAVDLPTLVGDEVVVETAGYETHTEVNTEDFADIVPPCQGLTGITSDDEGTGESNPDLAEEGVITLHDEILGDADLDPDVHGWTDPVARVTITAVGADTSEPTPDPTDEPTDDPTDEPDARQTSRLAGATRIDTAVAISQRQFPDGAATVYLAGADNIVDAVAGGSLTDGPVLLVPSCDGVPDVVADEIDRLDPDEVIALGGTAAICQATLDAAAG